MILDIKHQGLFRVDFLRIVLDIDHKAIAEYSIEHSKKWDRYTTYHDHKINYDWMAGLPDREKFEDDIYEQKDKDISYSKEAIIFTDWEDNSFLSW